MLRRILTVSLALALLLPALLRADDATKTLDKDLVGKWESTSVVINGEELKEFFATILVEHDKVATTEGTRITIAVDNAEPRQVEDSSSSGTIKVDPKSWAIDFLWEDGPAKGKALRGIYNVKADGLLLCMSRTGKDRPTEFSTKKGSDCWLERLKRVKK